MCSLDGLHRGTNRIQRGPRSVIHYWAYWASMGATQSSHTQINNSFIYTHALVFHPAVSYTHFRETILQIAGTLQGRICSLDGPLSPHRGTNGIPEMWSITRLTGRLRGGYKLIMHVHLQ